VVGVSFWLRLCRAVLIRAYLRQSLFLCVPSCPLWFKVLFSILTFWEFRDFGNLFSQLHHLNPLWTLRPVVHPAHNHVALLRVVPVPQKIFALKFHFHVLVLPLPFGHFSYCHTIRKRHLPALHRKSQPSRQDAKCKHRAGFIGRRVCFRGEIWDFLDSSLTA
jgi:hypothetical protein